VDLQCFFIRDKEVMTLEIHLVELHIRQRKNALTFMTIGIRAQDRTNQCRSLD